jgi:hypothetical protein
MPENWEQLKEYIRQLKSENEDLARQVAMLSCEVERYEKPYR